MSAGDLRARTRDLRDRIRHAPRRRPLSHLLIHFAAYEPVPTTVARLRDALADRGIAAILFMVGAFNCLPLPLGSSMVSGIPALMLAWQLMLRREAAWLPRIMLDREISAGNLEGFRKSVVPRLFWLEKFIKPRYWPIPHGRDEAIIGFLCVVLAIALIIPLPFGNWPPAFSITILALALLQRDGILLLIGLVISAISLAIFTGVAISATFLAGSVFSGQGGALLGHIRQLF